MLAVSSVLGNSQRLDGGAMFGNVPRALWEKWCPPDELGRIDLSCRCFLVDDGERKILIETGVGAFFEPKLRERFGIVEGRHVLLDSLAALGVLPEEIDVVLLSHLHFDHAGGLLSAFREGAAPELCFPRAEFVVGETAWQRARVPHFRDRASFIPELGALLVNSGRLKIVADGALKHPALGERVRLLTSSGHTPGMLLPTLCGRAATATFCADLVPGVPWVHLPITMGYDRFPEQLIDEKRGLYEELGLGAWLLFTHDQVVAAGRLGQSSAGKYEVELLKNAFIAWDLDELSG
jgi:glyoxylase-like metal-dependent hydrolase (beta-lactamase superfamily II)